MASPKVLTTTTMVAGAQAADVRVVETRRPNRPHDDVDEVHVQVARGPVALQLYGTLRELQLVAVEIVDGLTKIGRARGMEGR
jgi:hypothetical protein